jgi:GT2 family glycosyltransferase
MIRVRAFRGVGGFNPVVIAGEEPEMCVRLRSAGWNVLRVDAPMTLHDADMHYFGQWWRRAVRSGYAFAEGAWMHGGKPERHCVRESLSIWFWAAAVPLATLALARPTSGWSLLLLLGYGILAWRISRYARRRNWAARDALLYTFFILLGKIPQLVGQTKYFLFRAIGRRSRIIEYKAPRPTAIRKPAQPFQESH